MSNEPIDAELEGLPPLFSTRSTKFRELVVYMHFHLGSADWYAVEYSPKHRLFYGYLLNGGGDKPVLKDEYFTLYAMKKVTTEGGERVARDPKWERKKIAAIDMLVDAAGRSGEAGIEK